MPPPRINALLSFSACDVTILNPEDSKPTVNGQGVTLRCKVTSPDVFDRWSNPLYKSSIQSDPNVNHRINGDEHDLIIVSMNVLLAGVWTCHSQNNSDDITLTFSRKCIQSSAHIFCIVSFYRNIVINSFARLKIHKC
jgi:hypothetical protein